MKAQYELKVITIYLILVWRVFAKLERTKM